MKKMGVVGLLVFLLVVSVFIPAFVSGPASSASLVDSHANHLVSEPAYQYDPNIIFQKGIVFDDLSSVISVDPWVRDFAIGDLNGDGLNDLAVISNKTDCITILNGTTDGGFSTTAWRIQSSTTRDLRNIAIGDLDGDGKDDIVVSHLSSSSSPQITILYQVNGFDTSPTKSITKDLYGDDPYQLEVGHFGGASNNDVAVICSGNPSTFDDHVTVWRYPFGGLSNVTDISIAGLTNSRLLAKGDINGDGRTDLIVGNKSGSDVVWIEQPLNATDTWSKYTTITVVGQIVDIQTADIAGNGRVDLAVAESSLSKIHLYYNTGSRLPLVPNKLIQTYSGLSSIVLGKINGDAATDLVALSSAGNNASVFFESPSHDWYSKPNYTFPVNLGAVKVLIASSFPTIGDVLVLARGETNGEGTIEQFFPSSGKIGNANMNFIAPYTPPSGLASGSFETGKRSIAATSPSTNEVLIFELGSDRKNKLVTQNGPSGVDFGAFDPGTSEDLVVANTQSDSVSIYIGSGGIYTQHFPSLNVTLSLTFPSSIVTGRVQQLPVDDIVVGCKGGIVVLYNSETQPYFSPSQSETLQTGLTRNVTEVYIGDFNGDGTNGDIAALTEGSSTIQLFFRSSSGGVGNYYSQFPNANLTAGSKSVLTSMAVGDFNGDGRSDICATNDSSKAYVFLQPDYGFYEREPWTYDINLHQTGFKARSADVNDDGISDLIVSYRNPPEIAVYLNRGSGVFTNNMNFTTGGRANDLIAQDINGDGRADFASSSGSSFSLSLWFQNNLAPSAYASASKYTEKEGVGITFGGSGSNDSYSDRSSLQYSWTFGDSSGGNGISVLHRYLDNGIYRVSLMVTDRGGLTNYSNLTVTITDAAPAASFTYSPPNPVEGNQVTFTDTSTSYPDQIVNWTWEFGDGDGKAYTKDSTHVYMGDGTYSVSLTVADDDGSQDKSTKNLTVADAAPRADFTVSNLSPLENTTVYFNDTSYSYPDTIVYYSWVFGDGSVEAGPVASHVSHVYLQNGSYNVTLTVTDSDESTSKHWDTVQVQDSVPTASFEFSPSTPFEGQTVQFNDKSTAYDDGVVSWYWNFGDGNSSSAQNPYHQYERNGTYDVTLTVHDGDESASQKTVKIMVQDTSPTVSPLTANSGLTYFKEDDVITFSVVATPGHDQIKKYEWNFTAISGFVTAVTTPVNHTTHSYPQQGTFRVVVRVWDSDSYSEKILPIEIENVRPIANFSYSMSQTGEVMFDASISSDTPSDVSSLQFRWNFGDGTNWSPWYSDPVIRHTFVNKSREYSVVLNVRDDDREIASKAMPVIVDTTRPVVIVLSSGQGAVVGAPITISTNVTDDFGIYNVTLHYRIGDEVRNVTMSQSAADIYEGQIPSQNSSVTIFFWIQAFDNSGNSFTTGEYEIIVQTAIPLEYWYGGIGGLAMLAAGLFLGIRRYYATVDEAFIIYEDGRLIAHQTRHLKPGMDDDVLSSMLVAIQDFVKDSFKDERATALKRLDFGEKKILVEKGDRVYLAAVLHGKHAGKIPQKMLQAIEEIQKEFGPVFAQWDGNLEDMRGVKDKTQPLFKKKWTISIKRFAVLRRSPNEIGPLMIECPVCDQKIPADSKRCPSCGVDLTDAGFDDLEQVAHDMLQDETSSSRKDENTEK